MINDMKCRQSIPLPPFLLFSIETGVTPESVRDKVKRALPRLTSLYRRHSTFHSPLIGRKVEKKRDPDFAGMFVIAASERADDWNLYRHYKSTTFDTAGYSG